MCIVSPGLTRVHCTESSGVQLLVVHRGALSNGSCCRWKGALCKAWAGPAWRSWCGVMRNTSGCLQASCTRAVQVCTLALRQP